MVYLGYLKMIFGGFTNLGGGRLAGMGLEWKTKRFAEAPLELSQQEIEDYYFLYGNTIRCTQKYGLVGNLC